MTLFIGTNGNDNIQGSNGDDQIFGNDGNDYINALSGDDYIEGGQGEDVIFSGDGDDTIISGDGSDNIWSGAGDDYIVPGDNDAYIGNGSDSIDTGDGYDVIDYSQSTSGWYALHHRAQTAGIELFVDGTTNTAWVDKGVNGYTSIIDINNALLNDSQFGVWGITHFSATGTNYDDVFTFDAGNSVTTAQFWGGDGSDTYNLTLRNDVRLEFNDRAGMTPLINGVNIDLSVGTVFDDGYGSIDTINLIDLGGQLSLFLSVFDDHVVGGSSDDQVIMGQGDNFFDGGDGQDLVRYDRSGVLAVNVDLEVGTASGIWGGEAFSDTLINVENVRGSNNDDDTILGSSAANVLDGRGGNDHLDGRDGDDTIIGGGGDDTLLGGLGNDVVTGNAGNDLFVDTGISIIGTPGTIPGTGSQSNGKAVGHDKAKGKGHDKQDGTGNPAHDMHGDGEVIYADDDTYTGGSGNDAFVFGTNNGHDTITDFDAGAGLSDVVDLSSWGLNGLAELLALADDQGGTGNTVITYGEHSSITLEGVGIANLTVDDFVFV